MNKFAGMETKLDQASQLLKAMASPNRLMLLCMLAEGEKSVSELAEKLNLRQSTVSQHLARLRLDQLVTARREGQSIYYRIADRTAEKVIQILYNTYCGDLNP